MSEQKLNRLAALEAERMRLVTDVQSMESQLAEKHKYDPDGRMWDVARYHEWRATAVTARFHRLKRLREVKAEISRIYKEQQQAERRISAGIPVGHGADTLLREAYALLRRLANEGVDLDPPAFALMDTIRAHLQTAAKKGS